MSSDWDKNIGYKSIIDSKPTKLSERLQIYTIILFVVAKYNFI